MKFNNVCFPLSALLPWRKTFYDFPVFAVRCVYPNASVGKTLENKTNFLCELNEQMPQTQNVFWPRRRMQMGKFIKSSFSSDICGFCNCLTIFTGTWVLCRVCIELLCRTLLHVCVSVQCAHSASTDSENLWKLKAKRWKLRHTNTHTISMYESTMMAAPTMSYTSSAITITSFVIQSYPIIKLANDIN